MNQYFGRQGGTPPVVKNLLIINALFFAATYFVAPQFDLDLTRKLGLYYWFSPNFEPYQIATHMFMHGGIMHLAINMFVLWMFGSLLERVWGGQRFLIFYFLTAIGAALLHNGVKVIDIQMAMSHLSDSTVAQIQENGYGIITSLRVPEGELPFLEKIYIAVNTPSVGASGAIYGLLVAYGVLFPNTMLYLYFAIPIRAKYAVAGMIVFELLRGFQNSPGDNIAHFAHLGGALFGFLIVKYWNRSNRNSLF